MIPMETVDERTRRTGFIAGPNHRQMSTMDSPQPEPQAPAPNYRSGEDGHQCMDCAHYDMNARQCQQHNFAAKPLMVCDSFESKGEEAAEPEGMSEYSEQE